MGGHQSTFTQIEKKYGSQAIDYIVQKRTERIYYERTKDELQRINDHVNIQENEDIEWINQEKRALESFLEKAIQQAQAHKKGLISQSQAKHKKNVRQFSGYNDEVKRLDDLEKRVRQQYKVQREKARNRIDLEIKKGGPIGGLSAVSQFDSKPQNARKTIEQECFKKYPQRQINVDTVEIQRNLRWDNFKGDFEGILKRTQEGQANEENRNRIRTNIIPASAPICC